MQIDIRTLFVISVPLFGFFSFTALYLWRSHKDVFKGIGCWSLAFALQSIAGVLFVLRDALHDWLSIVVANSLITLGYVLFFDGISLFTGKKSKRYLNYIALAVVVVLFVYYGLININLSARIITITLVLAFILFHTAYLTFTNRYGDERETYLLNSVLFSGIGFVYLLRFPITLLIDPGSDFMRSGIYQSANILVYVLGGALIAIGLILLVNRRLSSIQVKDKTSLAESEERFKQLAEATFEGIAIHDMGKVLDCNELVLNMFQYTREEAMGVEIIKFISPEDQPKVQKYIAEGRKEPYEIVCARKDGSTFHAEIHAKTAPYKGSSVRVVAIRDITERMQIENVLRTNAAILDNLAEGVYLIGADDLIIKWTNPVFEKMFGYEKGELIGKKVDIVNAPSEKTPEETINSIVQILEETGEWHGDVQNIRKDGTRFWCHANVSFFDHFEYGKVLVSVHTDITQQKQAQQKVNESEETFRTLFETANDAIFLMERKEDGMPGKFIEVNEVACKRLGYSRDELLLKSPLDITPKKVLEKLPEILQDLIKNGFITFESVQIARDGRTIHVENSSRLFNFENRESYMTISRDITERKNAEEALRLSLKEKEILLREIHHRVKNNMQVITSLLKLQAQQVDDEFVHEIFESSQSRIRSMSLVHEQLYKSESLANIGFQDYLEKLVSNVADTYDGHTSQITVTVDTQDLDLSIDSSIPCGLIVTELVSNAYKYAFPKGRPGTILITADKDTEDMINLRIEDDGKGIPKDVELRKTESLGLKLVYMLAEHQLSGNVKVDRQKGTRFHIRFKDTMAVQEII